MQSQIIFTACILCLHASISCTQISTTAESKSIEESDQKQTIMVQEPHSYGGWYCPDNLGGFPAVDISDWKIVPVLNGRMATKEETQNGTSLIFVDLEKYPDAKPLDMVMPKLARYYNRSSRKDEIVIVIQALNISNDSVVGFRFLNGGNGSARMNEIKFLSHDEINNISPSHFVTIRMDIDATKNEIWEVLTAPAYFKTLQAEFDKGHMLAEEQTYSPKVNFKYAHAGEITAEYAGDLYGNKYVQIDAESDGFQYVEKFFVGENEETELSEMVVVCGPYGDDYEAQKQILTDWANKVKELSEEY